ncbi:MULTISPECIES: hypothetical protein [unclassified Phenylobacterium]|uniref:hypothetical protein n=1 Tax=unclassified Phenylobacterium TaxID=2640670 RepID=UPI00083A9E3B|nr:MULTISPECIES: hypothetical protein [unclassified Phenylobacterium]
MTRILLALGLSVLAHGAAQAQEEPCRAPQAAVGQQVRGPVLHVIDGHTLCVAQTPDPATWVKLELQGAPAAAAWAELMSVGFGKDVVCVVGESGATCRADGHSLAAAMGAPEAKAASAAWRAATPPLRASTLRVATVD